MALKDTDSPNGTTVVEKKTPLPPPSDTDACVAEASRRSARKERNAERRAGRKAERTKERREELSTLEEAIAFHFTPAGVEASSEARVAADVKAAKASARHAKIKASCRKAANEALDAQWTARRLAPVLVNSLMTIRLQGGGCVDEFAARCASCFGAASTAPKSSAAAYTEPAISSC